MSQGIGTYRLLIISRRRETSQVAPLVHGNMKPHGHAADLAVLKISLIAARAVDVDLHRLAAIGASDHEVFN